MTLKPSTTDRYSVQCYPWHFHLSEQEPPVSSIENCGIYKCNWSCRSENRQQTWAVPSTSLNFELLHLLERCIYPWYPVQLLYLPTPFSLIIPPSIQFSLAIPPSIPCLLAIPPLYPVHLPYPYNNCNRGVHLHVVSSYVCCSAMCVSHVPGGISNNMYVHGGRTTRDLQGRDFFHFFQQIKCERKWVTSTRLHYLQFIVACR